MLEGSAHPDSETSAFLWTWTGHYPFELRFFLCEVSLHQEEGIPDEYGTAKEPPLSARFRRIRRERLGYPIRVHSAPSPTTHYQSTTRSRTREAARYKRLQDIHDYRPTEVHDYNYIQGGLLVHLARGEAGNRSGRFYSASWNLQCWEFEWLQMMGRRSEDKLKRLQEEGPGQGICHRLTISSYDTWFRLSAPVLQLKIQRDMEGRNGPVGLFWSEGTKRQREC